MIRIKTYFERPRLPYIILGLALIIWQTANRFQAFLAIAFIVIVTFLGKWVYNSWPSWSAAFKRRFN